MGPDRAAVSITGKKSLENMDNVDTFSPSPAQQLSSNMDLSFQLRSVFTLN
jgi:hypothetical protein